MNAIRKTLIATAIAVAATLTAAAQDQPAAEQPRPVFGYISYATVFRQMPEYADAQQKFEQLRAQYDAEARRAEDEFQRKFSEFLQGQKDFPRSIMQKRQTELQELMDRSIDFRNKAQQLLADAQTELQRPVEQRLEQAIGAVAAAQGLLFVVNTDNHACPWVNPLAGTDLYEPVLRQLGLAPAPAQPEQPTTPEQAQ